MSEPSAELTGPPGEGLPPSPPATSDPAPDPSDPSSPITVHLAGKLIGDLGHPRVDAQIITAVIHRNGHVARWLAEHDVDEAELRDAFPTS